MSRTVIKGLRIIEVLARNAEAMGPTEIARALDMDQSAVQRILGALTERGYVARPKGTRKYQLSLAIWELGSDVIEHHQQRRLVHPILRFTAQSTGFTAFLTYSDHPFLVYLDKVEGIHGRAHSTEPGNRIPIHRTAAGRAVLAFLPEEQLSLLAKPQKDWTGFLNFEATNLDALRQHLNEIRQRRFAISESGLTRGVNSIAAPIWSATSLTPFGSIAITAEEHNMPATAFQELGVKLVGLAREATIALGGTFAQQVAEHGR